MWNAWNAKILKHKKFHLMVRLQVKRDLNLVNEQPTT